MSDATARRRFAPGTTIEDLKAYMGPFVDRLGYKFNTESSFVDDVLASELEILEKTGDVYCPCRVRTGDPKEDVRIICPCISFHRDEFAAIKKCWCGLFILKEVEDGSELFGVIEALSGDVEVPVFRVEDLPPGQVRHVKVGKNDIAVARVGDEFFALSNVCRHAFAPLADGFMDGYHVMCPWHGWRYDVRDGTTDHPDVDVRTYPVTVRDGEVFVTVRIKR
ncbi:Rieske 2Fe-2S domain-containing protein [Coriobacteriia bacterium Es71-Z0120]|uniref:Rieske 2Fe-2S domain-containing protein n=1 Tax=Parvivirga hydrogeniphila TaxID=2939460 RepID=UPI0022609704|nr:Rieske 2Fe-2S domain-containing protein [Parvivirga hydrogeniphila]MCL4079438.1 Rieske 2Fe-2S domain-containing protein [Parvivirga hydrogeniphila]